MSLKLIPDLTGFDSVRIWGRYTADNDGECYLPLSPEAKRGAVH